MNTRIILALSASAMAFGLGVQGCAPVAFAKTGDAVSANPKRAAAAVANTEKLMAKGKTQKAVLAAEEAVSYDPLSADTRNLLGRAYLADGRLVSAEQAFRDTLSLQKQHPGATLSLALVRIALGDTDEGRQILMDAEGLVSDSDRGLGLALAGDFTVAIPLLKQEAQVDGENVKARQNLAFALAMNGQWREARSVAGYDLGPSQVADRIQEWAQLSQPANSYDQVAYLLGIRPVEDQGQPTALALGPSSSSVKLASAEPILPVTQYYPPVDKERDDSVGADADPTALASTSAANVPTPGLESVDITPTPAAMASNDVSPAVQYIRGEVAQPLPFVPEAQRAAGLAPKASKPGASAKMAFVTENVSRTAKKAVQRAASVADSSIGSPNGTVAAVSNGAGSGKGKYVVQVGAFSDVSLAQTGWSKTIAINPSLSVHTPISSSYKPATGKSLVRLAFGGFGNRNEAVEVCQSIKAKGGVCFVRPNTADVVPQWAKATGGSKTVVARR